LIIWQHRRGTIRNVYVNQIRERPPIIGVKLADNKSRLKIENLKKDRPSFSHKTSTKQKKTKEQLEKLNKQIQLLQLEISKHKQNEERLEKQVTELMTPNKNLRQKAVVNNQVEQSDKKQPDKMSAFDNFQQKMNKHKQAGIYSKRQIIEMPTVNGQPQHELAKSRRARQQSTQQTGEVKSPTDQSKQKAIESKEPNWMLREKNQQVRASKDISEQPLDVEKLKALAALAKQIRGQRR
jgi:hypothetical protein